MRDSNQIRINFQKPPVIRVSRDIFPWPVASGNFSHWVLGCGIGQLVGPVAHRGAAWSQRFPSWFGNLLIYLAMRYCYPFLRPIASICEWLYPACFNTRPLRSILLNSDLCQSLATSFRHHPRSCVYFTGPISQKGGVVEDLSPNAQPWTSEFRFFQ